MRHIDWPAMEEHTMSKLQLLALSVILLLTSQCPAVAADAAQGAVAKPVRGMVSVVDFGAHADGTTDDSPAFQAAIDAGAKHIYAPSGVYMLKKALNMTDRFNGIILEGDGFGVGGTKLIADTGAVCIDCTGAEYITLRDFSMVAGKTAPSTCGVLFARSTTHNYAQFNSLRNVTINLGTNISANGGLGNVGVYDLAAELWRGDNIYITADNPLVFSARNPVANGGFNITSAYKDIDNNTISMSACVISGMSTLTAKYGPALYVSGGFNITADKVYMLSGGGSRDPNRCRYAIKTTGAFGVNYDFDVQVEGFRQVLWTDVVLKQLRLRGMYIPSRSDAFEDDKTTPHKPVPAIYLDASNYAAHRLPGLVSADIDLIPNPAWVTYIDHPLIQTDTDPERKKYCQGIKTSRIRLYAHQTIDCDSGGLDYGNIIQSTEADPSIKFSNAPGTPSYILLAKNGVSIYKQITTTAARFTVDPADAASGSTIICAHDSSVLTLPAAKGATGFSYTVIFRGSKSFTLNGPTACLMTRPLTARKGLVWTRSARNLVLHLTSDGSRWYVDAPVAPDSST
jgi:hypothetical protein